MVWLMPHLWKLLRPGWIRPWTTWSSCRLPCSLQGNWIKWSSEVPPNSKDSTILWYVTIMTKAGEQNMSGISFPLFFCPWSRRRWRNYTDQELRALSVEAPVIGEVSSNRTNWEQVAKSAKIFSEYYWQKQQTHLLRIYCCTFLFIVKLWYCLWSICRLGTQCQEVSQLYSLNSCALFTKSKGILKGPVACADTSTSIHACSACFFV